MPNSIFAVVTTINEPREYIRQYLERGIDVVVVADAKTPDWPAKELTNPAVHFLSLKYQESAYPRLSELIGFNRYQRKNLGYLYAAAAGASAIVDTDDDTVPTFRSSQELSCTEGYWKVQTSSLVWNPYPFFLADEEQTFPRTWPRGFPLSQLDEAVMEETFHACPSETAQVDVIQCLIAGHPDIDSIQRLCHGLSSYDISGRQETVLPASNTWFTGNTQASVWLNPQTFDYLFIPTSATMRFCDVLRTYIAQTSCSFAHKGFLFEQKRNIHSFYQDFVDESQLFQSTEILYQEFVKPNFRPTTQPEAYTILYKLGLITEIDIEALALFSQYLASSTAPTAI